MSKNYPTITPDEMTPEQALEFGKSVWEALAILLRAKQAAEVATDRKVAA